ncbi:MAG: protein kinase, partial [Xanthomonadales bacterium]|nr:protein kinase [Xanthomonadales bacterium]
REGELIDRFRLIRVLGEGGAGVVYLAEEVDQDLHHQVALKLLHQRYGPDDPTLTQSLHERRLLARLTHPGITRYFGAGVTGDGLCYVVVEYIEGLPITRYIREQHCSASEALRLFAQAARAVHHAHQNLIIHRDIKPSNLLIDARHGLPKLLDFGIARDLEGRSESEETVVFAYTPAYASPEQLAGSSTIGTPTDLYSLGLVLYEILHGELPVVADQGHPGAQREQLRKLAFPPLGSGSGLSLAGMGSGQRADLDLVLRRLLAFHAEDRYPSAEALAADIERITDNQPIGWGHHAWSRRAWRLLARHRALSITAGLGLLMLFGGLLVYALQARDLARQATHLASVRNVLEDLLTRPDPLRRGNTVTLAETLDEMAAQLLDDPAVDAEVKADISSILGRSLLRLGEIEPAQALLVSARDYYQQLGPESNQSDRVAADLVLVEMEFGRYGHARDAAQALVQSLEGRPEVDPERRANALRILATAQIHADNDLEAAAANAKRALQLLQSAGLGSSAEADSARTVLALALSLAGKLDQAEAIQAQVLSEAIDRHGEQSGQTFDPRNNLARTLQKMGQPARAEALLLANRDLAEALFGADAPDTLMAQNNLALNYFQQQRYEQAVPLMRAVYQGRRRVLGPDHPRTHMAASNLADALLKVDEIDESCALSRAAEQGLHNNPDAARHLRGHPAKVHSRCLSARGELPQALSELDQVIALWEAELGASHLSTLSARQDRAKLLAALGQYDAALRELEALIEIRSAHYGAEHPANREALDLRQQIEQRRGPAPS